MRTLNLEYFNLSTRRKRRSTMAFVISLLVKIKSAEEVYIDRVPQNLKDSDAVFNAELSIDCILEAIDILMDAY